MIKALPQGKAISSETELITQCHCVSHRERSEMKQSQGLWLLPFARNDCKYFCPITYNQ